MGKKKRGHPDIEEILARPWCYYCERDFDDLRILIDHQKAKHFKCERCGRRLNTAGGLEVHMTQVHKESLTTIENALPNRSQLDIEIFGMEGIPPEIVQAHRERVLSQYAQAEAERRAASGNPAPGGGADGSAAKKPKFESPSDLKKRLAEHKAKKAADEAVGASDGSAAPPNAANPPQGQPGYASPGYPQRQMSYAPPGNATYNYPPQTFGQPGQQFQQTPQYYPPQSQSFGPPPGQFPPGQYNAPPFPNGAPPAQSSLPPRPPNAQGPPQGMTQGTGSNGLPPAPGLPQRPSFSAPPVNAQQMQQMHQGQLGGPSSGSALAQKEMQAVPNGNAVAAASNHASQPGSGAATPAADAAAKADGAATGKKSKKDKETRLVYSDENVSPEEKMAALPRYAFVPAQAS